MRSISIQFNPDTDTPLYLQLADALRDSIRSGATSDGERLPSIRRLADAAGVNPATAVAAYRLLEKEGWAEARAGSGIYARSAAAAARGSAAAGSPGPGFPGGSFPDNGAVRVESAALAELAAGKVVVPAGVLDLAAGAPSPALFPVGAFKALMNEVLDRDGGWAFGYQEIAGWPPLRRAVADYYREERHFPAAEEDVRIVSGAQQGLDLAAKALLGARDAVAVETPTYRGALSVFWSRGAETIPVPAEADGMDLEALERIVRARHPKLVYVIPRYQNPTTVSWSAAKLSGLLALARRHDFFILEDDLLSDLSYGAPNEPSCLKALDADDRVIYVHGFSKVLIPGLRLGAIVGPRRFRDRFEAAKRATDISTDGLAQRALELYLRRGLHREQLERLRAHYGAVYAAALAGARSLERFGVSCVPPGGGLHLWLALPAGTAGTALRAACLARGCSLVPEAVYAADAAGLQPAGAERGADAHVRVSFAAVGAEDAGRGFSIIADALNALRGGAGAAEERPLL